MSLGLATQRGQMLSSPWFGVFQAKYPKGILLGRSFSFSQTPVSPALSERPPPQWVHSAGARAGVRALRCGLFERSRPFFAACAAFVFPQDAVSHAQTARGKSAC